MQGVSGNLALEARAARHGEDRVRGITITNAALMHSCRCRRSRRCPVQTLSARGLDVNTVNGAMCGSTDGPATVRHIRTLDGDLDLQTSLVKGCR